MSECRPEDIKIAWTVQPPCVNKYARLYGNISPWASWPDPIVEIYEIGYESSPWTWGWFVKITEEFPPLRPWPWLMSYEGRCKSFTEAYNEVREILSKLNNKMTEFNEYTQTS